MNNLCPKEKYLKRQPLPQLAFLVRAPYSDYPILEHGIKQNRDALTGISVLVTRTGLEPMLPP